MYQNRSYVAVVSTRRAMRAVIAKWYLRHEHDRPRPTLARRPHPSLASRAVRVACYHLRAVETAA